MRRLSTYKLFESGYDEMKSIVDNLKDLCLEFEDNGCQCKIEPSNDIRIKVMALRTNNRFSDIFDKHGNLPFYIEIDIDRRIITPDENRSGFGPLPDWFITSCRRIEDYMNSKGYKTFISKRYALDWENVSMDELAEQSDLIYKVKLEFELKNKVSESKVFTNLKPYRLFEGLLSKDLSREEVINLLQTKCKKFLADGYFDEESMIFRKDEDRGNFVLVNPKLSSTPRISPYSGSNFHNLIISNLDSWKGWPRRNKSLIAASSMRALTHASGFSKSPTVDYVVIPFDTTKVATGDRSDFWECFKNLPNRFRGEHGRPVITGYIGSLMSDLGVLGQEFDNTPFTFVSTGIDTWGKSFSKEMIIPGKWITKMNPEGCDKDWEKLKPVLESAQLNDALINKYFKVRGRLMWDSSKNLLENLDQLLNPISNGFKLGDVTTTMKLYSELDPDDENFTKSSLESWLEDECILIKYSLLDSILEEIGAFK